MHAAAIDFPALHGFVQRIMPSRSAAQGRERPPGSPGTLEALLSYSIGKSHPGAVSGTHGARLPGYAEASLIAALEAHRTYVERAGAKKRGRAASD